MVEIEGGLLASIVLLCRLFTTVDILEITSIEHGRSRVVYL